MRSSFHRVDLDSFLACSDGRQSFCSACPPFLVCVRPSPIIGFSLVGPFPFPPLSKFIQKGKLYSPWSSCSPPAISLTSPPLIWICDLIPLYPSPFSLQEVSWVAGRTRFSPLSRVANTAPLALLRLLLRFRSETFLERNCLNQARMLVGTIRMCLISRYKRVNSRSATSVAVFFV